MSKKSKHEIINSAISEAYKQLEIAKEHQDYFHLKEMRVLLSLLMKMKDSF